MLSETLSSLCDTFPTPHYRRSATYACRDPSPPPHIPLHHHHHYCPLPPCPYDPAGAESAVLLCPPRLREYQEQPYPPRPPPRVATVRHAAPSEVVILGQEEDDVLRQAMLMQRSIALLSTSVQQLEPPPAPKRKYLGLSTKQAMVAIIDAQSAGESMTGDLSSLYQVLRKKRDQPRYQCSVCGSVTTTQWRNTSSGKKICNPCGMRQWRTRRQDSRRTGSSKSSGEEVHAEDVTSPQSTQEEACCSSRRSNIYSLLN